MTLRLEGMTSMVNFHDSEVFGYALAFTLASRCLKCPPYQVCQKLNFFYRFDLQHRVAFTIDCRISYSAIYGVF